MFDQDLTKFAALMVGIGEVYGKSFTSAVINIYWNVLKAYRYEEIKTAIKRHLENPEFGRFLPKPSDIIMAIDGSPQNQALRAWTKVAQAIKRVGIYTSVAFDDALIHAVIEDMGGWIKFCSIDDKQLPFTVKEFYERYRGYTVNRPTSYPKYLVGVVESKNRSAGYKYDPPILIGDESKARHVIATGNHALTYDNKLLFSTSYSTNTTMVSTKNYLDS